MAELTINADDVRNALNEFAASYEPGNAERVEVGRVTTASDGIARVEGLPSVMANELVRFEGLLLRGEVQTSPVNRLSNASFPRTPVSPRNWADLKEEGAPGAAWSGGREKNKNLLCVLLFS